MFSNKKKCSRCKNSVKGDFDFCPNCGNNLKSVNDREDYGILGKNDFIEEEMFPNLGGSMMDKVFDSAFKMAEKLIEKQMKSMAEEMNQPKTRMNPKINDSMPGVDIQFFVNGKRVVPDSNGVMRPINTKNVHQKMHPMKIENKISEEKLRESAKLPRKEAESKVRRLSGKIIYELEMPGVDDIKDVMINQLENSIEVKAFAKTKVYHKTLNVKLPILKYGLDNGNLILELQAR